MEESGRAKVRFTAPPDAAKKYIQEMLLFFPWQESELARDLLAAFLAAALAGVKEYISNKPLMLHITGGQKAPADAIFRRRRDMLADSPAAVLFASVRDMLADSPAVVCVPAGTDSAGVAAALRACPQARLLMLEDVAPVKSALRYIVQNAGGVAVLAFSQDTFIDANGGHLGGALELRLRDYVDDTEKNLLAECRSSVALNIYRANAAARASAALAQAENAEKGRADLAAAALLDNLTAARDIANEAILADAVHLDGIPAVLREVGESSTPALMKEKLGAMTRWQNGEMNGAKVLATLEACAPFGFSYSSFNLGLVYNRSIGEEKR